MPNCAKEATSRLRSSTTDPHAANVSPRGQTVIGKHAQPSWGFLLTPTTPDETAGFTLASDKTPNRQPRSTNRPPSRGLVSELLHVAPVRDLIATPPPHTRPLPRTGALEDHSNRLIPRHRSDHAPSRLASDRGSAEEPQPDCWSGRVASARGHLGELLICDGAVTSSAIAMLRLPDTGSHEAAVLSCPREQQCGARPAVLPGPGLRHKHGQSGRRAPPRLRVATNTKRWISRR